MAASDYLTLGRGEVHFAPFLTGTTTPGGFKALGNCPEFNLTIDFEELTHMDSRRGFKEEDASAITSRSVSATITCDHISPENLGYFFMGTTSTLTQSSGTDGALTVASAELGASYQLGVSDANPTGHRSVSTVVVEDTGGAGTTYVVNVDYTVDAARGIVTFLETGNITAGDSIDITYAYAATTRKQVISGQAQIEGALQFRAYNAEGADTDYFMPYAKLRPTGDLALIGDDWMQFQFNVKGLLLPNRSIVYADGQPIA